MKLSTSLALAMLAVTATSHSTSSLRQSPHLQNGVDAALSLEHHFLQWMQFHQKTYQDHTELSARMEIWMDNHAYIERHNNQDPKPSYFLGHNQFSDLTVDEYRAYNKLGFFSPGLLEHPNRSPLRVALGDNSPESTTMETRQQRSLQDLPDSVDWVAAGAVNPVKNQLMCGSCWAFSAICAIEGAHFLDTGVLVSLSEQELVDCDPLDAGCGGGLMDNAFLFDENSTGICSEEEYPYVGHKRWLKGCASAKGLCTTVEHTRVKGFIDIDNTVEALMEALVYQPVSVAIEADQRSFQLYKSGVYDDPECGNNLDHGVAAVGYGTSEDGVDYFVVRNSWGEAWGDAGYVKLARQSPTVNGTCGILTWPSRPELRENYD